MRADDEFFEGDLPNPGLKDILEVFSPQSHPPPSPFLSLPPPHSCRPLSPLAFSHPPSLSLPDHVLLCMLDRNGAIGI